MLEGYKVVPREATEEMLDKGAIPLPSDDDHFAGYEWVRGEARAHYEALLSAAPTDADEAVREVANPDAFTPLRAFAQAAPGRRRSP